MPVQDADMHAVCVAVISTKRPDQALHANAVDHTAMQILPCSDHCTTGLSHWPVRQDQTAKMINFDVQEDVL